MGEDDDFLSRWSRRKRAVAEDVPPSPELAPSVDVPEPEPEPATEEDETALLEKLGLPLPETLTEGDDFAVFMKAGVPEFLRKRALRVLWRSNPVLANLDGLNDYDDDFNAPELTQKVLATGYQVGRGFVKKVLDAKDAADEPSSEPPEPDIAAADIEPSDSQEISENNTPADTSFDADDDPAFRPRRMRFES